MKKRDTYRYRTVHTSPLYHYITKLRIPIGRRVFGAIIFAMSLAFVLSATDYCAYALQQYGPGDTLRLSSNEMCRRMGLIEPVQMPSLDEGLEKFDIKNDISSRDALHASNRNDPVDEAIKPGALAPETTPQPNICYPLSATTVDIYMYHYVRESRRDTPGSVIYNNSITPETARAHYAHLSQMQQADTAHIALMSEIEQYQTENCFPHKRMIVLMFDDGRRDNYRYLLPLAREFNIKANLGIVVDRISFGEEPRIDAFMNATEIWEMLQSGFFEMQAHSRSHIDLRQLGRDAQWTEICESTKTLEKTFNVEINTIVYPMGLYDLNSTSIAAECGLTYGLTTKEGDNNITDITTKPFQLWRHRTYRDSDPVVLFGE